jgi:hypothetical protein
MVVALTIALCLTFLMLGVLQIDSKIVQDLPENNKFKKWWNKHIADRYPDEL